MRRAERLVGNGPTRHIPGQLDDGRGRARVSLFRHKHEIESGRTSSVGMEVRSDDLVHRSRSAHGVLLDPRLRAYRAAHPATDGPLE